jgi:hypothetical protein
VTNTTIDNARGEQRNPNHLDRPDGQADGTEEHEVDCEHHAQAKHGMWLVKVALDPVVRRSLPESLDRSWFLASSL